MKPADNSTCSSDKEANHLWNDGHKDTYALADLSRECHAVAKEKGWYDTPRGIPELLCLVHSELSEALECYREDKMDTSFDAIGKPLGFQSEIADTFIRLFDLAGFLNIDLDRIVAAKMHYNRHRPYRHGGKKA